MKIFVTGGNGFLGSNLIRELINRGHELCVLVQPGSKVDTLKGLRLGIAVIDILDFNSLKAAAKDSEAIFHLAACTSLWPARNEIATKVNIEGTQNIIHLAKELDVKRLVHVGTANTFGFGTKENPGREDSEYMGSQYGLDYLDSKWKAHQLVMEAVREGVPALIVNPTSLLGEYDSKPNFGAMIMAIYAQKLPGSGPGGRNYINVKDAVKGIANALDKGNIGESYIIGNENLSYREVFVKIASVLKLKSPIRRVPKWGMLAYGRIGSSIAFITGRRPTVSFPMAKIACDAHYFSSEKAVRDLDLPQTPIEDGILESFEWLKSNGYIKT